MGVATSTLIIAGVTAAVSAGGAALSARQGRKSARNIARKGREQRTALENQRRRITTAADAKAKEGDAQASKIAKAKTQDVQGSLLKQKGIDQRAPVASGFSGVTQSVLQESSKKFS